jgi:transcriptional regulator with XRE-family HTH domain
MVNKAKTYSPLVLETVKQIGVSLQEIQQRSNVSLKTIATNSGLSINSIKSIFKGATANIASYDSLARALGTSLLEVASTCCQREGACDKAATFSPQG